MSESRSCRGGPTPQALPLALWGSSFTAALESLYSPFVLTLANGSLPKSAFQHYVAQDATFLSSFGDAYKFAINKAHTAGSVLDVKPRLLRLLQGVQEELQLHGSYAAKWGIDLSQGFVPSPATTAYTDFLQAVAHADDTTVGDILAAMAPCSRLYAWLGCALADAYPGADHQYAEWIETYSGAGYMALPDIKEGLLHELTRDQPPPAATSSIAASIKEGCKVALPCTAYQSGNTQQHNLSEVQQAWFARLQPLYHKAMGLERDFFYAQPDTPAFRVVKALVVNFDGSCYEGNAVAAQKEQEHQHKQHQHELSKNNDAGKESQAQVDAFLACLAANQAARLQLLDQLLAPNVMQQQRQLQQHGSLQRKMADGQVDNTTNCESRQDGSGRHQDMDQASTRFDQAGLDRLLEQLAEAEQESRKDLMRAYSSLKGVPSEELRHSAQRLPLRPGCKQALQHARDVKVPMHVATESWPSSFVADALGLKQQCGQADEQQQQQQQQQQQHQECKGAPVEASQPLVYVHANDPERRMHSDSDGISRTEKSVQNLSDRKSVLRGFLDHLCDNPGRPGMNMYVGGCALDLGAMLGADCGVMIGNDDALNRVAACYGVQVRPLVAAPLKAEDCVQGVVYRGRSWLELEVFLFGSAH